MKSKYQLFLFIILILTSCNGQNKTSNYDVVNKPTLGKKVSEISNGIWYIFQDSKKNYWFSSDGEGVFYCDGKTIINYTQEDGLGNNRTRHIQEDKQGNIYISTFEGISKYDGNSFTTLIPEKSNDWKLKEDDLWFFTLGKKDENGPCRYDGKKLHKLEFPKHFLHDKFKNLGKNSFFGPYDIYTIYKDRKGALWFGTAVLGACRYDGKTIKWMYEEDLTNTPSGGCFGIRSFYEDKEGKFWICNTWHKYIFDFNKTDKTDRLQYEKTTGIGNKENFDGEEYIYYSHIIEDKEGNIWLTTWSQGVYKYDGKNIINYPVKENNKMVNLISMYKDSLGNLLLGSKENGVFKFNGKTFEKFIL